MSKRREKRLSLLFSVFLAVFSFLVPQAQAVTVEAAFKMTVSNFHALSAEEKADTIDLVLSAMHNLYMAKNKEKQAKCMKELYRPPLGEKTSYLVAKIYEATGGSLGDLKVADVIIDVIENNCPGS